MSTPVIQLLRRWWWRVLLGVAGLAVLAVAAALWLVTHLDQPWVKRRVQSEARSAGHVELDYAEADLSLSGSLRLSNVSILQDGTQLLRLGNLLASWDLWSMLTKSDPAISWLGVSDVTVTLPPSGPWATPASATSSGPLSRRLRDALRRVPPVKEASLKNLTVIVPGATTLRISGLGARMETQPHWKLMAGTADDPLVLRVSRQAGTGLEQVAEVLTALDLDVTPEEILLTFDARLASQTFLREWKTLPPPLHAQVVARVLNDSVEVELKGLDAGKLFHADARVHLPDVGPPLLIQAKAEVAPADALALLPEADRPLQLRDGQLSLEAASVVLGDSPHLAPGGFASLQSQLTALTLRGYRIPHTRFEIRASPDGGSATSGELTIDCDALESSELSVNRGRLAMDWKTLTLNTAQPLASVGQVTFDVGFDALNQGKGRVHVNQATARFSTLLTGRAPYALLATAKLGRLRERTGSGPARLDVPVRAQLEASVTELNPTRVKELKGSAELQAEVGEVSVHLVGVKRTGDEADFNLGMKAQTLHDFQALLGPRADWVHTSLSLGSIGHVKPLFSSEPVLEQETLLRLGPLRLHQAPRDVTLKSFQLMVKSRGNAREQEGELEAKLEALALGDQDFGDQDAKLNFSVDTEKPWARLDLRVAKEGKGENEPWATLKGQLSFQRKRRLIDADLEGKLTRAAALTPFLEGSGVNPEALEVGLLVKGTVGGLVSALDADGTPTWSRRPLDTATPDGTFHLSLQQLVWEERDRRLTLPGLEWDAEIHSGNQQRTLKSELTLTSPQLQQGAQSLVAGSVHQSLNATLSGNVRRGELELTQQLTLHALQQGFSADYPVGDMRVLMEAQRDRDGLLRIAKLTLDNPAGGTSASFRGGLDLANDRRRLFLRGDISLDLAKIWNDPRRFKGQGKAALSVRVSSGNLETFHTLATVKMAQVQLELPDHGITLSQVDGEVPLVVDVAVGRDGITLLRDAVANPYTEARFSDQHPMLSQRSFLSIARVTTPWASIAPLAGNLQIQQNIFSVGQLDMGVSGGRVTGQAVVEWNGADSSLEAHVRATDVRSSHGEPFDGNIAMVYSARDRSLDGRADVLKIGRRHLYDLLDIQDPTRTDASINRIRAGLELGYPDKMRVSFNHGFASVKVSFGGLARLLTLDEIRGIPVGPLIDKLMARAAPVGKKERP